MEVTLTLGEIHELVALLSQRKVNLVTLRLKTEEIQDILTAGALSKDLSTSLEKALPCQHFPTGVEDVNLLLLSYLNEEDLVELSLLSKNIRSLVIRQDLWWPRIQKHHGIDVPLALRGQESPLFALGFYRQLNNYADLKIIPIMRGGSHFAHLFNEMWPPVKDLYSSMVSDPMFIQLVSNAVNKEDVDFLLPLIEQDIWCADKWNTCPALIGVIDTHSPYNIISLAVKRKKTRLLICIFERFRRRDTRIQMLETISRIDNLGEGDTLISLLSTFSDPENIRLLTILLLKERLSKKKIDKILSPHVLSILTAGDIRKIIDRRRDTPSDNHVLKRIGEAPNAIHALEYMAEKKEHKDDSRVFRELAAAINTRSNVCTLAMLESCHKGWFDIKILLSHATIDIAPKLVKIAASHNNIHYYFICLPSKEVKRAFLEQLNDDQFKTLTYAEGTREEKIDALLNYEESQFVMSSDEADSKSNW